MYDMAIQPYENVSLDILSNETGVVEQDARTQEMFGLDMLAAVPCTGER